MGNKNINDIYDFLITGNSINGQKYLIELINEIDSTLNIKKPETYNIKLWCVDYSYFIKKRLSKLDHNVKDIFIKLFKDVIVNINRNIFTNLLCIPMDVYCLSRLFTRFKEIDKISKINKGNEINERNVRNELDKSICKPIIENAIIYTGSAHTYFYMNFINTLCKSKPDYLVDNFDYQCVDIPYFLDY